MGITKEDMRPASEGIESLDAAVGNLEHQVERFGAECRVVKDRWSVSEKSDDAAAKLLRRLLKRLETIERVAGRYAEMIKAVQ